MMRAVVLWVVPFVLTVAVAGALFRHENCVCLPTLPPPGPENVLADGCTYQEYSHYGPGRGCRVENKLDAGNIENHRVSISQPDPCTPELVEKMHLEIHVPLQAMCYCDHCCSMDAGR